MSRLIPLLFSLILLLTVAAAEAHSSHSSVDGPYRIHVVTVGQGEELFTRFGHIALMVEDMGRGERLVYNFGTFDFEDPKLRFRYARGFLNYWLSVADFDRFFYFYAQSNRDMWLQTLNLSDEEAAKMAHSLAKNALPENRYYLYRHFLDNCCTRVRDAIDEATDGAISKQFKSMPVERDFRYWTAQCLEGLPLYRSVILYSLGPAIDQPLTRWDEEFLPEVLLEDLDKVAVGKNRVPLVARRQQLLRREGPPIGSEVPAIDIIVMAILCGFILIGFAVPLAVPRLGKEGALSRRLLGVGLVFWGLLAGLGSLMLVLYWTVTTHFDTHYNENLLVNPLFHLWLIGPGVALIAKARLRPLTQKVIYWYLIGALGLIALDVLLKIGPFIQGNFGPIALAVALNTAAFFALKRTKAI
ncbi:MAG: DUF4105 domain-containing protein [Deltaproteobacteria bacterium]|nr:DUF4105 domain-containing protein [Deltaproteobacteria bacterium]